MADAVARPGAPKPGAPDAVAGQLGRVGAARGWKITYGILTIIAGLLVVAWPGATVVVIALVFAVQLLVLGVFWLVAALAVDEASGGGRALLAILGLVGILIGILCLRAPFQTVAALALLLGLFWTVGGVIEIFHSLAGDRQSGRWWGVVGGVLSVIVGIIVLTYPITSAVTLAWILGIFLIVYGAVMVGRVFVGSESRSTAGQVSGNAAPATG
ncbi:MAG: HdeD family acid-resistance protein [Pseudonocardiales bacterium]